MNDIGIIVLGGVGGGFTIVDCEDFGRVNRFSWHQTNSGYVAHTKWSRHDGNVKYDTILLHRLIAGPGNFTIDHKNGVKTDNRACNLRACTKMQNCWNRTRQSTNTSGFRGVRFHKSSGRWQASIMRNYQNQHLGTFDTPMDAARAYNAAAVEKFGEFFVPNQV